MTIQIRAAECNEIPIVHEVMRASFEEYRNKIFPPSGALIEEIDDIHNKISDNGGAILVWNGQTPVGSAQYYFSEDFMYIGRVAVITEARGIGIGKKIMNFLEEKALEHAIAEARIEVRLSVPQNIEFYSKLNYKVIEEHEYPQGTDRWYVMKKNLSVQ
ncbi:GNAT family N-acetyltransferase [Paenibacillus harenae]|uniref:GNAT family N-acetyltransferase n=1 Tax=Paenibacillus harenae TaxID=306543 RepID=UPI002792E25C|nr:GNAT family N-acetyltransferase [Paenibacillus harenae]MDQ0060072.1 ribosomal protein S18 acetylase RimI-like enzyme [Paenibacillus harenae]